MRVDGFVIRLRPRGHYEAADLGVRLYQSAVRSVLPCYLTVWAPLTALALACFPIADWLPTVILLCAKPWLDRTILFALSRAAFGQATRPEDLWRQQRQVLWSQLLRTWTLRRLSPWRSFTQPVYQLEGLRGAALRSRVRQVRTGKTAAAIAITTAFGCVETSLLLSLMSLLAWLAPKGTEGSISMALLVGDGGSLVFLSACAYALVIAFVEPFYVAAGFALYLNRRAELEAWDIEQELRRAFGK